MASVSEPLLPQGWMANSDILNCATYRTPERAHQNHIR
jgi:hypothetical protein